MGTQRRAASRLALGDRGLHIKQMLTDPALFTFWGHLGERKKKTSQGPCNQLSIHFQTSATELPPSQGRSKPWHGTVWGNQQLSR